MTRQGRNQGRENDLAMELINDAATRGYDRGINAAEEFIASWSDYGDMGNRDAEPPSWLSGEWAGESISELLGDLIEKDPDSEDEICDAYEDAADEAYYDVVNAATKKKHAN